MFNNVRFEQFNQDVMAESNDIFLERHNSSEKSSMMFSQASSEANQLYSRPSLNEGKVLNEINQNAVVEDGSPVPSPDSMPANNSRSSFHQS